MWNIKPLGVVGGSPERGGGGQRRDVAGRALSQMAATGGSTKPGARDLGELGERIGEGKRDDFFRKSQIPPTVEGGGAKPPGPPRIPPGEAAEFPEEPERLEEFVRRFIALPDEGTME